MENNNDKEKEAFLKKSVVGNDDSENSESTNNNAKKGNSTAGMKSAMKIIKNLLLVIVLVGIVFFMFRSCNKDKIYYYENGKSYFESGETEKGFEYLDKAIDLDDQYVDALMLRGEQYLEIEEYQDAEYDFSELITLNEKNWETYYLRGKSYKGQATTNSSPSYKKAIDDFTKSISLESGSKNSDSYYLRGDCKEISIGEYAGCGDFTYACDLGHEEGCARYDDLCYPKTEYMPYAEYFGKGDHSGDGWIDIDNTQSTTDILVVLKNINTGVKVRSQFIRKGEELTMSNIPAGYYELHEYAGNNWTYDKLMECKLCKDYKIYGGFIKNITIEIRDAVFDYNRYESYSVTTYKILGGTSKSKQSNFSEFMK